DLVDAAGSRRPRAHRCWRREGCRGRAGRRGGAAGHQRRRHGHTRSAREDRVVEPVPAECAREGEGRRWRRHREEEPRGRGAAAPNPMKDKREKLLDLQIEALSSKNDAKANPEPKALNAPDVDTMITKPRRAITQLKELSLLADDAGLVQQAQKNLPAFLSSD